MLAQMQSSRFKSPAPTSGSTPAPVSDPSRGRGNAAMIEEMERSRGFDIEGGAPGASASDTSREQRLAGGGDLMIATATSAKKDAMDANSYTGAIVSAQRAHPEWTLAQCVRFVNSQNVNGTDSQLAITGEADREAGGGVGFKSALVIGNGAYRNITPLTGAPRDAGSMAAVYGGRGYEVDHQEDLAAADMRSELRGAGQGLGEGDEMLLYYAGHAYTKGLLGVDATKDVKNGVVPNGEVLAAASRLRSAGVKTEVVLDACRTGAAADDLVARDELEAGKEGLKGAIQEGGPTEATPDLGQTGGGTIA